MLWLPVIAVMFAIFAAITVAVTGFISLVWAAISMPQNKTARRLHWLIPLVSPLVLLAVMSLLSRATQSDDWDRFEELFGRETEMADWQMISDDFGSGAGREVMMRIEPDRPEYSSFLRDVPLQSSTKTPEQFAALNLRHRLLWWYGESANSRSCSRIEVAEAPGFNGWRRFYVGQCPTQGGKFSEPPDIFIWASGRL